MIILLERPAHHERSRNYMVDKAFTPRAILEFCGFIRKAGFSGGEATEKGPEISEPSLTLTMLSFAAAVAATAATQEFPDPTHRSKERRLGKECDSKCKT